MMQVSSFRWAEESMTGSFNVVSVERNRSFKRRGFALLEI